MKKLKLILSIFLLCSFLVAGNAMAIPTLEIGATGASTITVDDNTDGTLDGIVSWYGKIGNFNLASTFGVTKPQDGSASVPMMHLNGVATTNASSQTLTVAFSETDFGPMDVDLTGFVTQMTGLKGLQSLEVYYDTSNALFGQGQQIADLDFIGSGNLFEIYNGIPSVNPFSLTMVATMTLSNGTGSFDHGVNPTPEPATMLMLGAGLLGLGTVARKKLKK